MTTGTPGDRATVGVELFPGIHQLSCLPGLGPQADQGLALGGGGINVGEGPCQLCWHCLWLLPQRRKWAACGHGAKVPTGGWEILSAPQFPAVSMSGTRGVAGPWRLGGRQGTSPGAVCALSKAWAQGETVRGVSGGSLPLGCPGSGFRVGLTSSLSVACCTPVLPPRGAVSGQWNRSTGQAFHGQGWPGLDRNSRSGLGVQRPWSPLQPP